MLITNNFLETIMGIKFSETACPNSKSSRPCVFKHRKSQAIGDKEVKHIWTCRRCGGTHIESTIHGQVECAMSQHGKHQWETKYQKHFQQHHKYRDITEIQSCSCCGAEREYSYKSMIGYNPHKW